MAKGLNKIDIELMFSANTSQAKKQLMDLQNSLTKIAQTPVGIDHYVDPQKIKEASQAALELGQHLNKAINVNTGRLDLSRFSQSLKNGNKDLTSYLQKLVQIGPQGQHAFNQMVNAMSSAELPATRLNKTFTEMLVTLKNTARWQISSSVLHGFVGSLEKAYRYAQDLDESLNNIRIVTSKSADEMARFAKQANDAAKSLSTTTTAYTDAALIYYQQGLSDQEVLGRTDVTVKMANVTGKSAEEVSQQLTAIWNNYYDGSKSLEFYADAITALGAATASSSDEIAQGLEKFSAIAQTVGLSYEYATAALATVTATTRQDADVVGNSFKTIFARLEGLSLGETLEDGTDLNKYSKALATVGVNIKDANGQLKDMDTILDELGERWQTLATDEKIAMAQTVAGVRQYNNLIALMDQWEFFKENLVVAQGSEGTLQKQAEIFAESWEAARKRVIAAAQGIYDSIINEKVFIKLADVLEKILNTIEGLVDGLGGMMGMLTSVGAVFMALYAKRMPAALNSLYQNFRVFTGKARTDQNLMLQETIDAQKQMMAINGETVAGKLNIDFLETKKELNNLTSMMTQEEREQYEVRMKNLELMKDEVIKLNEMKQASNELIKSSEKSLDKTRINSKENKGLIDDYFKSQETWNNRKEIIEPVIPKFNQKENEKRQLELSNKILKSQNYQSNLKGYDKALDKINLYQYTEKDFDKILQAYYDSGGEKLEENTVLTEIFDKDLAETPTFNKQNEAIKDIAISAYNDMKKRHNAVTDDMVELKKIIDSDFPSFEDYHSDNIREFAIQQQKEIYDKIKKIIIDEILKTNIKLEDQNKELKSTKKEKTDFEKAKSNINKDIDNYNEQVEQQKQAEEEMIANKKAFVDKIRELDKFLSEDERAEIEARVEVFEKGQMDKTEAVKLLEDAERKVVDNFKELAAKEAVVVQIKEEIDSLRESWEKNGEQTDITKEKIISLAEELKDSVPEEGKKDLEELIQKLKETEEEALDVREALDKLTSTGWYEIENELENGEKRTENYNKTSWLENEENQGILGEVQRIAGIEAVENYTEALQQETRAAREDAAGQELLANKMEEVIEQAKKQKVEFSALMMQFASAGTALVSVFNSIKNAWDVFNDEDASVLQKLGAAFSILTTAAMSYGTVLAFVNSVKKNYGIASKILETSNLAEGASAEVASKATWEYAGALLGVDAAAAPLIITIGAIAAALTALGIVIYSVLSAQDRAEKKLSKTFDNLDSIREEVKGLENEISSLSEQIDELLDKPSLTLTEKEDLERLRQEKAEAEALLEIKKEDAKLEAQKAIAQAEETYGDKLYTGNYFFDKENGINRALDFSFFGIPSLLRFGQQQGQKGLGNSSYGYNALESLALYSFLSGGNTLNGITKTIPENEIGDNKIIRKILGNEFSEEEYTARARAMAEYELAGRTDDKRYQDLASWMSDFYIYNEMWEENAQKIADSLFDSQEDYEAFKSGTLELTNSQQQDLQEWAQVYHVSEESIKEALKESEIDIQVIEQTTEDTINEIISEVNILKDSLQSLYDGKEFEELSEEQQDLIKSLEDKYEGLAEAYRIFGRDSKEYLDMLATIQDQEEKLAQQDLANSLIESQQKLKKFSSDKTISSTVYGGKEDVIGTVQTVTFEPDLTEVKKALTDLFDYQYQLDIDITSDILTDVDSVVEQIENIGTAIEAIGDDFVVAADKAESLFKVFPELAEKATVDSNGVIKLNQEVTDAVLGGYEERAAKSKENIVNEINDRIKLLEHQKKSIDDELKALAEGNFTKEELINKITGFTIKQDDTLVKSAVNQANAEVSANTQMANIAIENANKIAAAYQRIAPIIAAALEGESIKNWTPAEGIAIDSIDTSSYSKTQLEELDLDALNEEYKVLLERQRQSYVDQIADLTMGMSEILSGWDGASGSQGSGSDSENKLEEFLDDTLDRYYDINNAISAVNTTLEKNEQILTRLNTLQDHYSGKTLQDSLKKQNKLLQDKNDILQDQYNNYNQLYAIQTQELKELKETLGGTWDGDVLKNYAELFQGNLDRYNSAVAAYNSMSKEMQEAAGDQMIENAKTAYDVYSNALDRYQTLYYNEMANTQKELASLQQQALENQLEIINNNLQGWEIDAKLELDLNEAEREWNNFVHDITQDFRKIYESLIIDTNSNKDNFLTYLEDANTQIKEIADVEAELIKMDASRNNEGEVVLSDDMLFGSISEAQDKLKELQSALIGTGNELNNLYETIWDTYVSGLDQAASNFGDLKKQFDHLTNEIEYEKQLIELMYGDKAYDLMNRYYQVQQNNIQAQISSTQQQAAFWEDQFNKAYNMNKETHNVVLEDMSTWTEDMRKAYDDMIASQETLNDLIVKGIQNLKDEYLNNVAQTLAEMDEALWGVPFDELKDNWDFIQKKADEYYDDVEGAYEIQKLANMIDEGIAGTSDLAAQEKLMKLRENEIDYLREKENLTKDDLDLAEARYQIALKEIALEDAQANKNSMKLTRDTSGNWTYQYVADPDDIAQKRQELLDTYANLYKMADDAYKHAMDLAMSMYQEYSDKLRQIAEDTTLTDEERYIKMQELQDNYLPEIEAAMENAQIYEQEAITATGATFAEVCEQDADAYLTLTDLQKQLVDEIRDKHLEDYEEIREAVMNNYDEIADKAKETFLETNLNSATVAANIIDQWDKDDNNSVKGAMNEAFDDLLDNVADFQNALNVLEDVSGKDILSMEGIYGDFVYLGNEIDNVGYKTDDLVTKLTTNMELLRNAVNSVAASWDDVINQIHNAVVNLQSYLSLMGASTNVPLYEGKYTAPPMPNNNLYNINSLYGGTKNGGGGKGSRFSPDASEPESKIYEVYTDSNGVSLNSGETPTYRYGNTITTNKDFDMIEDLYNSGKITSNEYLDYKRRGIVGLMEQYATGGYTGESQNGGLAILHGKELVLNQNDTQNILEAVKNIRSIESSVNTGVLATLAGFLTNLSPNLGKALGENTVESGNVFNVTAEFPNANDVTTIRDAILSLPNIASQQVGMM